MTSSRGHPRRGHDSGHRVAQVLAEPPVAPRAVLARIGLAVAVDAADEAHLRDLAALHPGADRLELLGQTVLPDIGRLHDVIVDRDDLGKLVRGEHARRLHLTIRQIPGPACVLGSMAFKVDGGTSMDVGDVNGIWRFPVKSMGGERMDRADLRAGGIVGDRAVRGSRLRDRQDRQRKAASHLGSAARLLGHRDTRRGHGNDHHAGRSDRRSPGRATSMLSSPTRWGARSRSSPPTAPTRSTNPSGPTSRVS